MSLLLSNQDNAFRHLKICPNSSQTLHVVMSLLLRQEQCLIVTIIYIIWMIDEHSTLNPFAR